MSSSGDNLEFGGQGSQGDKPKKSGLGTGAIIGIIAGVLLLCCCLSCGGCAALNWDEFKKGFKEAQQQQKK